MSSGKDRPALFPLRSISIGIWSSKRSRRWLLYLPDRHLFVLLLACSNSKADTPWSKVWHQATDQKNPFCPATEEECHSPYTVIAFEVAWADMQGMDYTFPLHQDGRLVIEAKKIVKRTFRTIAGAHQYYSWRPQDYIDDEPQHQTQGRGQIDMAPATAAESAQAVTAPHTQRPHSHNSHHANSHAQGPLGLSSAKSIRRLAFHHLSLHGSGRHTVTSAHHYQHAQHHDHSASGSAASTPVVRLRGAAARGLRGASVSHQDLRVTQQEEAGAQVHEQVLQPHHTVQPVVGAGGDDSGRHSSFDFGTAPNSLPSGGASTSSSTHDLKVLGTAAGAATAAAGQPIASAVVPGLDAQQPTTADTRTHTEPSGGSTTGPTVLAHVSHPALVAADAPPPPPCADCGSYACDAAGGTTRLHSAHESPAADPSEWHAGSSMMGRKALSAQDLTTCDGTAAGSDLQQPQFSKLSRASDGMLSEDPIGGHSTDVSTHGGDAVLKAVAHVGPAPTHLALPPRPSQPKQAGALARPASHAELLQGVVSAGAGGPVASARPPLGVMRRRSVDTVTAAHRHHATASAAYLATGPVTHKNLPRLRRPHQRTLSVEAAPQLSQAAQRSLAPTPEPAQDNVPPPCRFTVPSAVYYNRTLVVTFRDPAMQPMLSQVVKTDMKLLHLYESGLPAWAIFMPSYGFWYRPWMRQVTFLLFTCISIVSMILGFYDLYKNVPIVRQAMSALAAHIFPPAQQLFEWLERHAQIRLSILLTYVFSKSPLFVTLIRFLRTCMGNLSQFVGPVWLGLRTFIAPVVSLTVYLTRGLAYALQPLGTLLIALYKLLFTCGAQLGLLAKGVSSSLAVLLGPPAQLLWGMLLATAQLVRLVCQLARVVVQGPAMVLWQVVLVLQMVLMRFGSSLGVAWGVVTTWGKAAKAAAPVAAATGRAVAAAARAAPAPGTSGWSLFARAGQEAWSLAEAARVTLLRCVKAFQAVSNFFINLALAVNRHRVSLMLELRSYLLAHPGRLWVPRSVATRIMHPQPSARFSLVPGDILPADLLDDTGQTSNPEDAASTAPPTPRSLAAATPGMRSVRESFDTGAAPRGVPRSRLGGIAAGDAFGAALAGISPSSSTTALAGHLPRQSLDGVPQMMLGVGGKADLHRPSPLRHHVDDLQSVTEVLEGEEDYTGEYEEWRGVPIRHTPTAATQATGARRRVWHGDAAAAAAAAGPLPASPAQDVWHEMVTIGPSHQLPLARVSPRPAGASPHVAHHAANNHPVVHVSPAKVPQAALLERHTWTRMGDGGVHASPHGALQASPAVQAAQSPGTLVRRASWPATSWPDALTAYDHAVEGMATHGPVHGSPYGAYVGSPRIVGGYPAASYPAGGSGGVTGNGHNGSQQSGGSWPGQGNGVGEAVYNTAGLGGSGGLGYRGVGGADSDMSCHRVAGDAATQGHVSGQGMRRRALPC